MESIPIGSARSIVSRLSPSLYSGAAIPTAVPKEVARTSLRNSSNEVHQDRPVAVVAPRLSGRSSDAPPPEVKTSKEHHNSEDHRTNAVASLECPNRAYRLRLGCISCFFAGFSEFFIVFLFLVFFVFFVVFLWFSVGLGRYTVASLADGVNRLLFLSFLRFFCF